MNAMSNRYAGKCSCCGGAVKARAGFLERVKGAWVLRCVGCYVSVEEHAKAKGGVS